MIQTRNTDSNIVRHAGLLQREELNARAIGNHMPALIEQGHVKRIQRGLYLINPLLVLPPDGTSAREMWDRLNTTENEMINPVETETEPAPDGTSSAP
jgi:hypothetical protein